MEAVGKQLFHRVNMLSTSIKQLFYSTTWLQKESWWRLFFNQTIGKYLSRCRYESASQKTVMDALSLQTVVGLQSSCSSTMLSFTNFRQRETDVYKSYRPQPYSFLLARLSPTTILCVATNEFPHKAVLNNTSKDCSVKGIFFSMSEQLVNSLVSDDESESDDGSFSSSSDSDSSNSTLDDTSDSEDDEYDSYDEDMYDSEEDFSDDDEEVTSESDDDM